MKGFGGRLGGWMVSGLSAVTFLIVLDATAAWTQTKFPNGITGAYIGLRNLRFSGQTTNKSGGVG